MTEPAPTHDEVAAAAAVLLRSLKGAASIRDLRADLVWLGAFRALSDATGRGPQSAAVAAFLGYLADPPALTQPYRRQEAAE